MSADLPDPPIPAGVDLQGFPFTPLYRARFFGSAFHAKANDAEWRAGVTLNLKAWDQVPAGSLPNDDIELCRLAELGRDLKTWRKVRMMALHGWYSASDGRLYNDIVAELVLGALQKKREQSDRTAAARQAAIARRRAAHEAESVTAPKIGQSQLQLQTDDQRVTEHVAESVTESNRREGNRREEKIPASQGADAPSADPIFGFGLDLLKRKAVSEKAARGFLGLMRKDLRDDAAVIELLQSCEREDISDPIPWLRKAMDGRKETPLKRGVRIGAQDYSETWKPAA